MEEKRYYWLKLHEDFFDSLRMKRLRKMAGGDTYLIIYLKLQLKAMRTDGRLEWKQYDKDIVEELAVDLDETPDNVRITLTYLKSCGLAESNDNEHFFFPYAVTSVGSEGSAAQRMREARSRAKIIENDTRLALPEQCANNVQQSSTKCELRYGEKEIEKEKESDKDNECSDLPSEDSEPPAYRIILNDNTYYGVSNAWMKLYREWYPAVDVDQEMRKMIGWCESNPRKRKTRRGIKVFINNWLSRQQDKGPKVSKADIFDNA